MQVSSKIKANRCTGATTVEMAISMVILIMVTFACFEFFRASMLKQYAENVSYEAARNVIVPGGSAAEAKAAADHLLNILAIKGAKVEVIPAVITDATTQVTVKVEIPFTENQWITPFYTGGKSATSETTLLTERVPNISIGASTPPPPPPPNPPPPERPPPKSL